ncbi:MAG TPA: peptidylprolyl isomerase [Burkholderiaceae bacterium]|nr:peptidylprolyl isomerase [Burkholderiaceae bacterium]
MFRKLPLIGALVLALNAPGEAGAAPNPQVLVKTSLGDIVIELYPDKAPKTVENFLQYVKDGFYSGTVFHRVIGNFMIQGGGHTRDIYNGSPGRKETRGPIPLEAQNGLKNDIGWVAMARTAQPASATSQFFINVVNNDSLNYPNPDGNGYAVFGKVIDGMKTVEAIRSVRTGSVGMFRDVPNDPVTIDSVTLIKAKP